MGANAAREPVGTDVTALARCLTTAEEFGMAGNCVAGANIAVFQRVAAPRSPSGQARSGGAGAARRCVGNGLEPL